MTPERSQFEHAKFLDYTYDRTLQRLEQYRDNLRRMCRLARERGVAVVMGTLFSNALAPPFVSNFSTATSPEERSRFEAIFAQADAELPERFGCFRPRQPPLFPMSQDWIGGTGCTDGAEPQLRPLLGDFQAANPLWVTRSGWSPIVCAWMRAMQEFLARQLSPDERAALERGVVELRQALKICPDHPLAHYQLGLYSYLLGRGDAQVLAELDLAARFDRAPLKASQLTNEIVRAVAGEFPEVRLVDLDELVRSRTPGGIIGWEIMEDHCHAHAPIYAWLMRDLADSIGPFWREHSANAKGVR